MTMTLHLYVGGAIWKYQPCIKLNIVKTPPCIKNKNGAIPPPPLLINFVTAVIVCFLVHYNNGKTIWTPEKTAVIILKFEQCGCTIQ